MIILADLLYLIRKILHLVFSQFHSVAVKVAHLVPNHEQLIRAQNNNTEDDLMEQAFANFDKWQEWCSQSPTSEQHHQAFQQHLLQALQSV